MPGIYAFFDNETLECLYVGQTRALPYVRWYRHTRELRAGVHKRTAWIHWINEAPERLNTMIFTWIEDCEEFMLNTREVYWFMSLKPRFFGKKPSFNESWEHNDTVKNKLRRALDSGSGIT